jgi:uncharacterized membrane protein YgdD (TMEM256/DUF423 family)
LKKNYVTIAAMLGALAVMLGAFGAHALKAKLTAEQLQTYEVGVRYHFYHVFAILIASILHYYKAHKFYEIACKFFIVGIVLFSGSLYMLSFTSTLKMLGIVTPFGGLCFIIGWVLVALGSMHKKVKT